MFWSLADRLQLDHGRVVGHLDRERAVAESKGRVRIAGAEIVDEGAHRPPDEGRCSGAETPG